MDPQTPLTHGNEKHDAYVEDKRNKGTENGYCPLDGDGEVPTSYLQVHNGETGAHFNAIKAHDDSTGAHPDDSTLEHTAYKNQPNGYCGLDEDGLIPNSVMIASVQLKSEKNEVDGYCGLDGTGVIAADKLIADHLPQHSNDQHTTAAPSSVAPDGTNEEGGASEVARADHQHRSTGGVALPMRIATTIVPGSGIVEICRVDFDELHPLLAGTEYEMQLGFVGRAASAGLSADINVNLHFGGDTYSMGVCNLTLAPSQIAGVMAHYRVRILKADTASRGGSALIAGINGGTPVIAYLCPSDIPHAGVEATKLVLSLRVSGSSCVAESVSGCTALITDNKPVVV
jgi:hypothetical protein